MPITKRLLRHVAVEIARGDRRCRRDAKHTIRPGSPCLTIQEPGTPFKRSYCAECALPMLKLCAADLRTIRDALYPMGVPVQVSQPSKEPRTLGEALVQKNRATARRQMIVREEITQTQPEQPTTGSELLPEQTPERLRKAANFRQ